MQLTFREKEALLDIWNEAMRSERAFDVMDVLQEAALYREPRLISWFVKTGDIDSHPEAPADYSTDFYLDEKQLQKYEELIRMFLCQMMQTPFGSNWGISFGKGWGSDSKAVVFPLSGKMIWEHLSKMSNYPYESCKWLGRRRVRPAYKLLPGCTSVFPVPEGLGTVDLIVNRKELGNLFEAKKFSLITFNRLLAQLSGCPLNIAALRTRQIVKGAMIGRYESALALRITPENAKQLTELFGRKGIPTHIKK